MEWWYVFEVNKVTQKRWRVATIRNEAEARRYVANANDNEDDCFYVTYPEDENETNESSD